jgi:hypothetical protein
MGFDDARAGRCAIDIADWMFKRHHARGCNSAIQRNNVKLDHDNPGIQLCRSDGVNVFESDLDP